MEAKNKETKELIIASMALIKALDQSFEDGKFNITDIFNFTPIISDIATGINGFSQIPSELKNLSKQDMQDLIIFMKKEFDLHDDKIESLIEKILEILANIIYSINEFRGKKNA